MAMDTFSARSITLPEYITILRRRMDLTQKAAADLAGINHRHLEKLERAEDDILLSDVHKLASAYGVTPVDVLGF